MTEDEKAYTRALALLVTTAEDEAQTALRRPLLALTLTLRTLLSTLPDPPLERRLAYNQLRPRLISTLQTFSNTIFTTLLTHLPQLERTTTQAAADFFNAPSPPLPRPTPELLSDTRIGTTTLLTLFTPDPTTNISPFTLQLLFLVERSLQTRFTTGTPTADIIRTLLPTRARPTPIPLPTRGTLLSGLQSRIQSAIAAAFWYLTAATQQRTAATAPTRPTSWRWNAILDPRTCPICRPLHNTTAPFPSAFPSGPPPVHPRCRCILLPIYS